MHYDVSTMLARWLSGDPSLKNDSASQVPGAQRMDNGWTTPSAALKAIRRPIDNAPAQQQSPRTGVNMDKHLGGGSDRRSLCSRLARRPALDRADLWLDEMLAKDREAGVAFTFASPACGTAHSLEMPATADRHGVHFYSTDEGIVTAVADTFEAAIAGGESMLLVATPEHRAGIEADLRRRGARLDQLPYHAFDAAETLNSLLVNGVPDRQLFQAVVGGLVTKLVCEGPLSIYGEMVNLLWQRGDVMAAMRLEGFWNELGAGTDFSLLCGYRTGGDRDASLAKRVSELHSHEMP